MHLATFQRLQINLTWLINETDGELNTRRKEVGLNGACGSYEKQNQLTASCLPLRQVKICLQVYLMVKNLIFSKTRNKILFFHFLFYL